MAKNKQWPRRLKTGSLAYDEAYIPESFYTQEEFLSKCYIDNGDNSYSFDGTPFNNINKQTLTIKSHYKGKPVTKIYPYAFRDNKYLKKIILPETLVSIGIDAFYDSLITSITIPKNVKEIDRQAFYRCTLLKKVVFDSNSSITKIHPYTFYRCCSLKDINLPSSVQLIDECAFSSCYSLQSIEFSEKITSIGYESFSDCTSLEIKDLPKNLKTLGYRALFDIKKISTNILSIPKGLKILNLDSFSSSLNVKKIFIPETVSKIKGTTNLHNLEEINVSKDNKNYYSIDGVLFNSKNDLIRYPSNHKNSFYTIPFSTKKIFTNAFDSTRNLRNVVFHDDIKSIPQACFKNSAIRKITLPKKIRSIQEQCFESCKNLEHLEIPKTVVEIHNHAFYKCTSLSKISFSKKLRYIGINSFYGTSVESLEFFDEISLDHLSFGSTLKLKNITFHTDNFYFRRQPFNIIIEDDTNYSRNTVYDEEDKPLIYKDLPLKFYVKVDDIYLKNLLETTPKKGVQINRPFTIEKLSPRNFKKLDQSSFVDILS